MSIRPPRHVLLCPKPRSIGIKKYRDKNKYKALLIKKDPFQFRTTVFGTPAAARVTRRMT